MTSEASSIGLVGVVTVVVGLFVILGVFLALAKWIMYLTIKPIWEELKTLKQEQKFLRDTDNDLRAKIEVANADNQTLVSQSMTEVVSEVGTVADRYAEFSHRIDTKIAALELDLANRYVTAEKLEREFEICRKTTHGV